MSNNFGDNLNFTVLQYCSKAEPVFTDNRNEPHILGCGSILTEANSFSTVWGAGFAWNHDFIGDDIYVITVRGSLSNEKIGNRAVMVGDPALIMPKIFDTIIEKRYKKSIIPHWKDTAILLEMTKNDPDINIINPLKPLEEVIIEILASENILSSSLHGLILSDAYQVPNQWLDIGTDIGGDGFKFLDYYSTTDNPSAKPVKILDWSDCRVNPYIYDIDQLIKTFPTI